MWEWLLAHPVQPGAVFLAEMLSPIAANPMYAGGPLFAGIYMDSFTDQSWEFWRHSSLACRSPSRQPAGQSAGNRSGAALLAAHRAERSSGLWVGSATRRWGFALSAWATVAKLPTSHGQSSFALHGDSVALAHHVSRRNNSRLLFVLYPE